MYHPLNNNVPYSSFSSTYPLNSFTNQAVLLVPQPVPHSHGAVPQLVPQTHGTSPPTALHMFKQTSAGGGAS